jgi:hypothetical protein
LHLRLSWSRTGSTAAPAHVLLEALDREGQVVTEQAEWVGTEYYPPSDWPDHSVVVQHVPLPAPPAATPAVRLRLSVYDAATTRPLAIRESRLPREGHALRLPFKPPVTDDRPPTTDD